jgi:hypothetical protein
MFKIILPPSKMSDPVAASAPVPADIATQRLAEAPIIESEWNAMSYKDRTAWWMSAKWYGYMSTEAYRRGDALNTEISCRYGEPGFFIATRVPYYEAQAAVTTITAAASNDTTASESLPTPTIDSSVPSENVVTPPIETSGIPEPSNTIQERSEEPVPASAPEPTAAPAAVSSNANSHKKKKKKHNKPINPSEGKTIEIRVGGQTK